MEVFFFRHNIYSWAFCSKWIFSQAIFFPGHFLILKNSRTFPGLENEFVFSGMPGNPVHPSIYIHV